MRRGLKIALRLGVIGAVAEKFADADRSQLSRRGYLLFLLERCVICLQWKYLELKAVIVSFDIG
jgi:hypothetical protein